MSGVSVRVCWRLRHKILSYIILVPWHSLPTRMVSSTVLVIWLVVYTPSSKIFISASLRIQGAIAQYIAWGCPGVSSGNCNADDGQWRVAWVAIDLSILIVHVGLTSSAVFTARREVKPTQSSHCSLGISASPTEPLKPLNGLPPVFYPFQFVLHRQGCHILTNMFTNMSSSAWKVAIVISVENIE
jgi:hypothetical protein